MQRQPADRSFMTPLRQLPRLLRRHLPALALGLAVAGILITEAPSPVAPGEQEFLSVHPAVTVIVMADATDASQASANPGT